MNETSANAKPAKATGTAQAQVLVVEDTLSLATVYIERLSAVGYKCIHAETASQALQFLDENNFKLILLDLQLPDSNGMSILEHVTTRKIETAVVIITANGSINTAVEAMRLGAFDFLMKPFSKERLLTVAQNAIESLALKQEVAPLSDGGTHTKYLGFIGSSPTMQDVYTMIDSVASSQATVFITGESGTGKELCAEAIHMRSSRRSKAFVPLNCGAIPKDLVESEVFGHLKGAFTGAIADRTGAAGQANGGTLFLDEVCEMELSLQTKLLRFLQTNTIQRVGSSKLEDVDVRVICATNRDPAEEVRAGRFREDLYYRLFVVPIALPPLRAREGDVVEIARTFLTAYAEEENKAFAGISPEAEQHLQAYNWPGNVRELQNVMRNLVVLNDGEIVTPELLPEHIRYAVPGPAQQGDLHTSTTLQNEGEIGEQSPSRISSPASPPLQRVDDGMNVSLEGKSLDQIEREAIEKIIAHCGGSIPKAAKILDVSSSTIYRKREAWEKAMLLSEDQKKASA
ncbi:MAG: sigma-54 dependent transcriptional regulator [Parvibaculaceae bacterium]|nr:sigma-54 dependent transcriptional regulator [Parvibaculaceae bacterium]